MRASSFLFLRFPAVLALTVATLLGGCATPPPKDDPDAVAVYKENNDPLEPMNRYFFEVNYGLDELLFKPLASWYSIMLPPPAERGMHNFLTNLNGPVIFANDAMQGESKRATVTLERFVINSTIGVGGIFDVAARMGLEHHDEDFGQTLCVWGVGEGPYLVVPLLGPSNPRDLTGYGVDAVMDPYGWILPAHLQWLNYTRTGVQAIDTRARNLDTLDQIRKGSLDYYATMRSLYRQHRNDEIKNADEKDSTSASVDSWSRTPQLSQGN
jgi:phospholipid-binding lipoprotein MlaA